MKTQNSVSQKMIILPKTSNMEMSTFWKVWSVICTEYLDGDTFAWMTASTWSGMQWVSLWPCWGVMKPCWGVMTPQQGFMTPQQGHRLTHCMPLHVDAVIHAKVSPSKYSVHITDHTFQKVDISILLVLGKIIIFWDTEFWVFMSCMT